MPNTQKTTPASKLRRTGYIYFFFWITWKVPIPSSITVSPGSGISPCSILSSMKYHKTRCFSLHMAFWIKDLFPRDGTAKLWMERLQDLFKTKLPLLPLLALRSLGDWISECIQKLWQIQTYYLWLVYKILALCRYVIVRKYWTCRDLHDKTKAECCGSTDASTGVLDFCAVTECCCNRVEESMRRTKWQTKRGHAAH